VAEEKGGEGSAADRVDGGGNGSGGGRSGDAGGSDGGTSMIIMSEKHACGGGGSGDGDTASCAVAVVAAAGDAWLFNPSTNALAISAFMHPGTCQGWT
jgi:hypothetical protein